MTEARRHALLELALARGVPRLGVPPRDARVDDDDRETVRQRHVFEGERLEVEQHRVARHGRARRPPGRGSRSERRARAAPPAALRARARAPRSPPSASVKTTCTAADDDSPAPIGSVEVRTPRHGRTASPSSAATASTDAARSPASETIESSAAGVTSSVTPRSIAAGSARPPTRSVYSPIRLTRPGAKNR